MSFSTRLLSAILVLVLVFSCVPVASFATDTPETSAPKAALSADSSMGENKPNSEPNDSSPSKTTRAEWMHELVALFSGSNNKEYADGFFSDFSQGDDYYNDVMQALEFGALEIAEGENFYPEQIVTRDFAAHTLNAYLGYIVEEDTAYSFSETDLVHPADAQIATERGWFALENGCFNAKKQITKSELEFMLSDAKQTLEAVEVDAEYESQYDFQDNIIEIPSETEIAIDDEASTVTLYDTDIEIAKGDHFVVYTEDLPISYKAAEVIEEDKALVVEVQRIHGDVLEAVDEQGTIALTQENCSVVSSSYAPEAGTEITVGNLTFQDGVISTRLKSSNGQSAEIKISNLSIDHSFSNSGYSIKLNGRWSYTGNIKQSSSKEFTLGEIRIFGIGVIKIAFEFSQSLSMSANVNGTFSTGFAVEKGSKRVIKEFATTGSSIDGKAEISMGIKVSAGVDILVASAEVYAEIGMKTQYTSKSNYNQSTQRYVACQDFKYYLFTEVGAVASYYAFWAGKQQTLYSGELELPDNIAKPYIYQVHFEDGVRVGSCSCGMKVSDLNFGGISSSFNGGGFSDTSRYMERDITLPGDVTIEGDYSLSQGTLDLNGHTLTIKGDFLQSGGAIVVGTGTLNITGDYRIQSKDNNIYGESEGELWMLGEGNINIGGNFYTQSTADHGNLASLCKGTMTIGGDFYQISGDDGNFVAYDSHKVVFTGKKTHIVSFDSKDSYFNQMEEINGARVKFLKGFIGFTMSADIEMETSALIDGELDVNGYCLTVHGSFQQSGGTIESNEGIVSVTGDFLQSGGAIVVGTGTLNITGDYRIQSKDNNIYGESEGELWMLGEGNINIGGSFYTQSTANHGNLAFLCEGTMTIGGDFYQISGDEGNFVAYGSHKVVLTGRNVTVHFDSEYSHFNILELKNPKKYYTFSRDNCWETLISSECDHNYKVQSVVATCTKSGSVTYLCSKCNYSYTEIIPAIGHSFVVDKEYCQNGCGTKNPNYVAKQMHYIIPSLVDINAKVTIKSDSNEYSVTADNGVFIIDNIKGDVYRVYAKQKNSLTICLGEYSTNSGKVVNNNPENFPIGDVNADDVIDLADLSMLLATDNYGMHNKIIDLTGDGLITIDDIAVALQEQNYGKTSVKIV